MSDDLERQVSAYFGAVAERVEVPVPGVPPAVTSNEGTRRSGRTPMLIGAALFVVAVMVIGFAVVRNRSADPGSRADEGVADANTAADPCSTIPVSLEPAMVGAPPPSIGPAEVLYFWRSINGMTDWNKPTLLVAANGTVIALDYGSAPADVRYTTATLSPAALDGLRACLTGPGFQALDHDYSNTSGQGSKPDTFCGLGDGSTDILTAGPAGGAAKSVSAYGLEQHVRSGPAPICDLGRPEALVDLYQASSEIEALVGRSGIETSAPSDDLDPTTRGD